MFISIPKFSLKSWVPPFIFENRPSPLLVSPPQKVFPGPPLFETFKIWVPPLLKRGGYTMENEFNLYFGALTIFSSDLKMLSVAFSSQ